MSDHPYFPLFVDLSGKQIVVIGAGKIALRRIQVLLQFADRLTVIAPKIHPELEAPEMSGKLTVIRKRFEPSDLNGADLVLAATDDRPVNDLIRLCCKERGIPVNISSDRRGSDFYFPGIARKDNIVIGITASGQDHAAAKKYSELVRQLLSRSCQ